MLPPVPSQTDQSSFAWQDYFTRLNQFLATGGNVTWANVNKAGSSLGDLATRTHAQLQSLAGSTDGYHMSAAQYAALAGLVAGSVASFNTRTGAVTLTSGDVTTALTYTPISKTFSTKSSDPTTTDIVAGNFAIYKNTTSGTLKLWANDGGTMKSVALT